jgi:uncharacterized protein (TIGR00369 family)
MAEEELQRQVRYLPTYDGCYVCGQKHPRGLRIRFLADEDHQVFARFHPNDTQTGYDGIVHGGVISSLLDELIGWSVSLTQGRMAFTAELSVRFLKPIHVGQDYLASSRLRSGRGRRWEAEGEIVDDQGHLCAKGHGRYFLLSEAQTAAVAERMTYLPGDLPAFQSVIKITKS